MSWLPKLSGQLVPAQHTVWEQHHRVEAPSPGVTRPTVRKNSMPRHRNGERGCAWPALCSRSCIPWPKSRQLMNNASASVAISRLTAPTKSTNFLSINPVPPTPHGLQPAFACRDAATAAKTSAPAFPPAKSNLPVSSGTQQHHSHAPCPVGGREQPSLHQGPSGSQQCHNTP